MNTSETKQAKLIDLSTWPSRQPRLPWQEEQGEGDAHRAKPKKPRRAKKVKASKLPADLDQWPDNLRRRVEALEKGGIKRVAAMRQVETGLAGGNTPPKRG